MSTDIADQVDIAIVGAGAVGLAAALALSREGRSVALLGPVATPRDGRTVALLDGSWRMLAELGVQEALLEKAAPLEVMRLVDDSGSLFLDFQNLPGGGRLIVLGAALSHPSNRTAAASASHLSRSVFYQRLALIEELLGVDLAVGETIATLSVALLAGPGTAADPVRA